MNPCSSIGVKYCERFHAYPPFSEDALRRFTDIPDNAEPLQYTQDHIAEVDFPPSKALSGTDRVAMMVVVPSFAHGQQAQNPVVAAFIINLEPPLAEHVRNRIDAEGHVIDGNGAQEETVEEKLPVRRCPSRVATIGKASR